MNYMKTIRFCAISDLHGVVLPKIEECDVLLIAGDTVDLYVQRLMAESNSWFQDTFVPWAMTLPCKKIYVIAGNHDFWMYRLPEEVRAVFAKTNGKVEYLEDEYAKYEGITIFGTPQCHQFFNWAFMPSDEHMTEIFDKAIEGHNEDIDILMSHDSPYGCSDVLFQRYNGEHIGSHPLRRLVIKQKPTIMVHGHLHSTNHEEERLGKTRVYNVSLLDEDYEPIYMPLYFNFNIDEDGNKELEMC